MWFGQLDMDLFPYFEGFWQSGHGSKLCRALSAHFEGFMANDSGSTAASCLVPACILRPDKHSNYNALSVCCLVKCPAALQVCMLQCPLRRRCVSRHVHITIASVSLFSAVLVVNVRSLPHDWWSATHIHWSCALCMRSSRFTNGTSFLILLRSFIDQYNSQLTRHSLTADPRLLWRTYDVIKHFFIVTHVWRRGVLWWHILSYLSMVKNPIKNSRLPIRMIRGGPSQGDNTSCVKKSSKSER